jgi:hypothetical protein
VDSERLSELTRWDNWPDLGPTASIVTPAGSIKMWAKDRPATEGFMKTVALVFIAGVMLAAPQAARGNTKAAAVPVKVLGAHKIYVEDHTDNAEIQNEAYLGLAKWGRFQLVETAKKADVVLRLNGGEAVTYVPTGEKTYLYNSSAGGYWHDNQSQVPAGFTQLTLVDPKTGTTLWSEQRKTIGPEAKRHIVDGLRDAFEQGEKERWK